MDTVTRRKFLQMSGATSAAALLSGVTQVTWDELIASSQAAPRITGDKVLVLITLYGGNDGLTTIAPYEDPTYKSLRQNLALNASEVFPIGQGLGINAAMTSFKDLWLANRLAVISGVGYPKPSRSHFTSMDIWQTGSPEEPITSGWIGRWLDSLGHDPLRALGIGSVPPPVVVGLKSAASVLPLTKTTKTSALSSATANALAKENIKDSALRKLAARGLSDLLTSSAALGDALAASPSSAVETANTIDGGSAGGQGSLDVQLDLVSRLIRSGLSTRVYATSLGGFDTHADEKGTQTTLLSRLATAVGKFTTSLKGTVHDKDVVIMIHSEFGRRVLANASYGTDHGTSGPVFLIGSSVKGGHHGEHPDLNKLINGDLGVTVDFRSIYAEVAENVLGVESSRLLKGSFGKLDLFS